MIHVAVAVIRNPQGEILLSKRPDHTHQGGLWEFPGGKVEPGESVTTALQREMHEELGITVSSFQPLIAIRHHYHDKSVLLDVWEIMAFDGEPRGKEGQPLQWVQPEQLACHQSQSTDFPLPAANFGIVKAIKLGSAMAISGEFASEDDFRHRLELAITRGVSLFQCRLPKLPTQETQQMLAMTVDICDQAKIKVVVNKHFNNATIAGVHGIHLTAKQLMTLRERPSSEGGLLGASCHNQTELAQAVKLDLDYVTLSPVLTTYSHPQAEQLGWQSFERLVQKANLPVYALGGIGLEAIDEAKQRGGQGIAAIGAFWNS